MSIEQYVNKIISYIELNTENKKDLKEELIRHISDKCSYYKHEGTDEASAVEQSLQDFSNAKEVGNELNKAFFPYRKPLLSTLSLLTILFTFCLAISSVIYQEIFPSIWCTLTIISSITIYYFINKPSRSANHRPLLIILMIFLNIFYFYSLFLIDGIRENTYIYILLSLLLLSCFIISISQIYLGVLYQPISIKLSSLSQQKRNTIIITNIITGVIICGVSLLFISGLLIFAPSLLIVIPCAVIVLWLFFLIGELKSQNFENLFRVLKISLAFLALGFIIIPQFML
ncbi:hypothetical protein SAMN04487943_107191 [Gracilibacillus orientalis]|uniref:Uncharacterized protein n=1 Tax=Gracilibacillus orientalis TaxID=334253 RepID=A0A1I4MYD9_9BACI|nr:hypothetical protein [Gracilibacillus orientalis]SFM08238.1 hypothetical protein SAMN04487943_107191 [Gracilibacillus orientalis]